VALTKGHAPYCSCGTCYKNALANVRKSDVRGGVRAKVVLMLAERFHYTEREVLLAITGEGGDTTE